MAEYCKNLAKVDGYLDSQRSESGSSIPSETHRTQYCGKATNLQICGDIRADRTPADRTPLLPDKSFEVTYSSYVYNPQENSQRYQLVLAYYQGSKLQTVYLNNISQDSSIIASKSTKTEFNSYRVEINDSQGAFTDSHLENMKFFMFVYKGDATRGDPDEYTLEYNVVEAVPLEIDIGRSGSSSSSSSSSSSGGGAPPPINSGDITIPNF